MLPEFRSGICAIADKVWLHVLAVAGGDIPIPRRQRSFASTDGGGKSLCFQLPRCATGLTVVCHRFIALMKRPGGCAASGGRPATFLNSSLAAGESRPLSRSAQGEFRLLYVAGRLMLSGFHRGIAALEK